jgi:hypothetical protein
VPDGVEFAAGLRARREGNAWVATEVVVPAQSGNSPTGIDAAECDGYQVTAHSHTLWEGRRARQRSAAGPGLAAPGASGVSRFYEALPMRYGTVTRARSRFRLALTLLVPLCLTAVDAAPLLAQSSAQPAPRLPDWLANIPPPATDTPVFRSRADSVEWARMRAQAHRATESRLIIDLFERRIFWVDGVDTLFVAQVAVGSGDTLSYRDREWQFDTPRGRRVVRAKEPNPVWVPPLWHYVRHARETGRELVHLQRGRPVVLSDGTRLVVRGDQVGRIAPDGSFHPVEQGDHIIFDDTVFVPPFGTVNRQIVGELGQYKFDLGNAYLIHGTPHEDSIGQAATHGCIRLRDDDLEFVYRNIPIGTPVYIY